MRDENSAPIAMGEAVADTVSNHAPNGNGVGGVMLALPPDNLDS